MESDVVRMKPKFCVITANLSNYADMAALTDANKREYCERHGYDFQHLDHVPEKWKSNGHAWGQTWARMDFMRQLISERKWDWLWCLGTDALITNLTIPLLDRVTPHAHIVIASDWAAPVQADSFLVRCSPEGDEYLARLLEAFDAYKEHTWVENQVMIETLPTWRHLMWIVPQRMLNAYNYDFYKHLSPQCQGKDSLGNDGQWQPGDFVLHLPGLALPVRMSEIRRTLPLIVK